MIHSFLMIGQSNMAGRGLLDEAETIDTAHIKILRNGRWQPMFRPINPDRPFSGVNLAESFAEQYAQAYGVDVGLIPCADGGTSLEQWQPGGLLFDHAVYSAQLAQRTSTIAGVLWHQGEADCAQELNAVYAEKCTAILAELRKQLDLYDVPFLLGGLGSFLADCPLDANLAHYDKVNAALRQIAATQPMTGFVSAEGLDANPDNLHFSAHSLYVFGRRYFAVYEQLRDKNKRFADKPAESIRRAMEML